jgi:hypothetical protein
VTGQAAPGAGGARPRPDGWRAAAPELTIAAVLVAAAGAAGYALGGPAAMTIVVIVAVIAGCAVLPALLPSPLPPAAPEAADPTLAFGPSSSSSLDYWRKRARVGDGIASRSAYDAGLRQILEHLLASRLAERHGISLYDDPAAARRLLCPGGRDGDLWPWVDPARQPAEPAGPGERRELRTMPGIPPRTLSRLVHRLEQL